MTGSGLYALCSLLFILCSPCLSKKDNRHYYQHIPTYCKKGNISDCWICHLSMHYVRDPWVLPVTNISLVPKATANYTHKPMKITYHARLLQTDVPISCFNLSPAMTIQGQLNTSTFINPSTFNISHSYPYLNTIRSRALKGNTNRVTPFYRVVEKIPLGGIVPHRMSPNCLTPGLKRPIRKFQAMTPSITYALTGIL